jgi:hypothetical protein
MRPRPFRFARAATLLALLAALLAPTATPAVAGGDTVRRHGSCSGGPGDWRLRVSRESASTIRVRFDVERVDPGDSWQLFLSDNGTRIFAGTRVVDADGDVRAVKITADRSGTDRVKGSGVNVTSGGSCDGSLRYRL